MCKTEHSFSEAVKNTMKNIEEIYDDKSISNVSAFQTEFGIEFALNFSELNSFVNFGHFLPVISRIYSIFREAFNSKDLADFIREKLETTNEEDELRKKMFIDMLEEEQEDKEKQENQKTETKKLEEIVLDLQVTKRMTDYFVLTLYTYLDVYSTALLQYCICSVSSDSLYFILERQQKATNPIERIKVILEIFTEDGQRTLSDLRKKLFQKTNWDSDFLAFTSFRKFRNTVAHSRTLATVEELEEAFPKQTQFAKKEIEKIKREQSKKKEWNKILASIEPLNLNQKIIAEIKTIFEELLSLYIIAELGKSCTKYMAFVDSLMSLYFQE